MLYTFIGFYKLSSNVRLAGSRNVHVLYYITVFLHAGPASYKFHYPLPSHIIFVSINYSTLTIKLLLKHYILINWCHC